VVEVVKKERRNLFKLILLAGGAFLFGKLFSSFTDMFSDKVISDTDFKNFRFVETKKTLTLYGKDGRTEEPLLIVEKDGF